MFKSKRRGLIIPQFEHTKLAASIANLWGNKDFERTKIPNESFVKGVLFHDKGYGINDNLEVQALTRKERKATLLKGMLTDSDDIISDLVSLHHIRRIIPKDMPELLRSIEKIINNKMQKVRFSQKEFLFADYITDFCDYIAFNFALDDSSKTILEVIPKHNSDQMKKVTFRVKGNTISIIPWPLALDYYKGFIIGYKKKDYPKKLSPILVPFILKKV